MKIRHLLAPLFVMLLLLLQSAPASASTPTILSVIDNSIVLGTPTLISGTDKEAGAVYKYTSVFAKNGVTVDANVTIVAKSSTVTITSVDQIGSVNQGYDPNRFEPGIHTTGAGEIQFRFDFFDQATGQPVLLKDFYLTGYDIGMSSPLHEYVEISGYSSYQVDQSTQLSTGSGANGRTKFTGYWNDTSGITFSNACAFIASYTAPVSSMDVVIGVDNAWSTANSSPRNFSLNFGLPGGVFTTPVTTTNPSSPTISVSIQDGGDGYLTASDNLNAVAISGTTTAEVGQMVTISVSDSTNTTTTHTATVQLDGTYAVTADLSTRPNGLIRVVANVVNTQGNPAPPATATTTKNVVAVSPVTVGGLTAQNKVYDRTTTASLNSAGVSLNGVTPGDNVYLVTTGAIATFSDKNVGDGKLVTVTGLSLGGADAAKYSISTQTTTTANITPLGVTGSFTAVNKTYDGTKAGTIATRSLSGAVTGDSVSLSGGTASFDTKDVGAGKTVTGTGFTLSGTDASNYSLTPVATATASITAKVLSVSFTVADKTYDGTTTATITGTPSLGGTVSGDVVSLQTSSATASFDTKDAGTAKTVTGSGFTLSGADATNYSLGSSTVTATASITAREIKVTADSQTKVYGQTDPTLTYNITNGTLVGGDSIGGTLTRAPGDNVGSYPILPGTLTAGTNYTITLVGANLTITKADATNHVTGYDLTYDGSAHTATGTAKGVNDEDLGLLLNLSGTTHTVPGTYTDSWSFAGNQNYNIASGTVSDKIVGAAALTGTVKTAAGFEVIGIQLYLTDSDGHVVANTTTGAGGAYRFDALPGGTYTVKVKSLEQPLTQATKEVPGLGEAQLNIVIPATANLTLVANPGTIVGNGHSTSQLQAKLGLLDNTAVEGVQVTFSTTSGTFTTAADVNTGSDGKASATLRAPLIEGLNEVVKVVSVRVQDVERGLFAYAEIQITFAPSSIDGVIMDNGSPRKPIQGAVVRIHKEFADGTVFNAQAVTDAMGRYSIIVPKGNTTYEAETTIPVTVGGVQTEITTKQTATVGEVSGTGDATPATKTISGQLFAPDPTVGGVKTIDQVLVSGQRVVGTLLTTNGTEVPTPVAVDTNGAFRAVNVPVGTYVVLFQVEGPNGDRLAGVRVPFTVSADGELTIGTGLIDPFGKVTSATTGLPIEGVKMELRWANTPLNISKGRQPNTSVELPELTTFLPSKNHVPQLTTATGEYAWMVFPDGDYYIAAMKSGYQLYDSRIEGRNVPALPGQDGYITNGIIHVGTTIVQYDLQLRPLPPAPPVTPQPVIPQGKITGQIRFVDLNGGAAKPLTPAQAESLTATLETADGQPVNKPVTIDASGSYTVQDLVAGSYRILFRANGIDGRLLAVTTVPVTVAGELGLQTTVIDPFRTVRDATTGNPLQGVLVTLLWADTPLNRSAGRTPGTPVNNPGLTAFAATGNANPHDSNEEGRYGSFCLPQGDYYMVAKKDGYLPYDSRNDTRTVSLGTDDFMKDGILHVWNGGCAVDFELAPMKLEVLPQYTRYILGYPDGTFKPERAITRAEVAAIFSRLMGTDLAAIKPANLKDLPAAHWASRYIAAVMAKGLMTGDPDGGFRPDAPITRAELATVIVRYKGLPMGRTGIFQDTTGHWAEEYISAAFQGGIVLGYTDSTFAPSQTTKRAELVAMVNRMLGWAQLMSGRAEPRWPDVPFSYWAVRHIEKASISHTAKPGGDQMDYMVDELPDHVQ